MENPIDKLSFDELVDDKLANMPVDTPADVVKLLKKRLLLEAMQSRFHAARQDDFARVKFYDGIASGLTSAISIVEEVFKNIVDDDDDDETESGEKSGSEEPDGQGVY